MTSIRISLVCLFVFAVTSVTRAQHQKLDGPFLAKKTIRVYGVCEMCKTRIEKAAKQLPGVSYAHWDADAQTLLVQYLRTRTNPEKIQKAVAASGHDTEEHKAADTAYGGLPDCCHYRAGTK